MVGASRIFGANGHAVFRRFLSSRNDGHIDGEQVYDVIGEASGRAVTDFFIIADVNGGALGGFDASSHHRPYRAVHAGDAGFVIQMTGTDEAVFARFHAGVEGDNIAHANAERGRFFFRIGAGINADFHPLGGVQFLAFFGRGGVGGGVDGQNRAAIFCAVTGKDGDSDAFNRPP